MDKPYSIPNSRYLRTAEEATPDYMYPSPNPLAIVWEGALSHEVCNAILDKYMDEEPYPFTGCDANTRECPRPLGSVLDPIRNFGLDVNDFWWKFYLGKNPGAWLQSYEVGDGYQLHMDGTIGQTRKLTVIALLTEPSNYEGGTLRVVSPPSEFDIPKTRGTMCVIPAWTLHDVTPVERGFRQTLNLGFYGPPFR